MLLTVFALGGALQAEGPPTPVPVNSDQWVLSTDYPAEAIAAGEEGTVGVRLDVDAAGRVASCTITQSAKSAALDAASCRLLVQRARFKPARDKGGKEIASTYEASFQWIIPKEVENLGRLIATVDLSEEGRPTKCTSEIFGHLRDVAKLDFCSDISEENESDFMTKHAAAYRSIRIIFELSATEAADPLSATGLGTLLTRQVSEAGFAEGAESASSCVMKSSWGEDLGPNLCELLLSEHGLSAAPPGKPIHTVRFQLSLFGTPR
jgi:TonB family protein